MSDDINPVNYFNETDHFKDQCDSFFQLFLPSIFCMPIKKQQDVCICQRLILVGKSAMNDAMIDGRNICGSREIEIFGCRKKTEQKSEPNLVYPNITVSISSVVTQQLSNASL